MSGLEAAVHEDRAVADERDVVLDLDVDGIREQRHLVVIEVLSDEQGRQVDIQGFAVVVSAEREMIDLVLQVEGEGAVTVVGETENFAFAGLLVDRYRSRRRSR